MTDLNEKIKAITEAKSQQIKALCDEAEKEIQALVAKETRKENQAPWVPKKGESYWNINPCGDVFRYKVNGHTKLETLMDTGNCFRTKKEAQAHVDKTKATVRVKNRIAELNAEQGWVADWENLNHVKYTFCCGTRTNRLDYIGFLTTRIAEPTLFSSSKTIKTLIKEIPEDIKLMLGVVD